MGTGRGAESAPTRDWERPQGPRGPFQTTLWPSRGSMWAHQLPRTNVNKPAAPADVAADTSNLSPPSRRPG